MIMYEGLRQRDRIVIIYVLAKGIIIIVHEKIFKD